MKRPARGTVHAKPVTPQPPSSADFATGSGSRRVYISDRVASNFSAISFTDPTPSVLARERRRLCGAFLDNAGGDAGIPRDLTRLFHVTQNVRPSAKIADGTHSKFPQHVHHLLVPGILQI